MSLTLEQVNVILDRVTYRPGWRIHAWHHGLEGSLWVRIDATVENSYQPGHTVDLGISSPLPPVYSQWELLDWLRWRLGIVETHEMREWLKLDGRPVFDPHADGVNDPPAGLMTGAPL